jgi:hypothetical protein
MQESLVTSLRTRRPHIRARWEDLLRIERASSPLAHPDALVHLIDWSLDEIFQALADPLAHRPPGRRPTADGHRHECACGRNPYLAYFDAGEQAVHEALVMAQAAVPALKAADRDNTLAEINRVLQHLAHREIEAFCGVCQYRNAAPPATPEGHPAESNATPAPENHLHQV